MTAVPVSTPGAQSLGHLGPEMLVWRDDLPVPRPGPGEVLVRVLAACVNLTDTNTRLGWYGGEGRAAGWAGEPAFPRIQGADLWGRIVATGAGVAGLPIAARAAIATGQQDTEATDPIHVALNASGREGALAQYCLVKAGRLRDVTAPPRLDVETGTIPFGYGTAHNLLARAGVAVGERVLVIGASNGVGLAAAQLAILRGAEVTAQCDPTKSAQLRALGATILPRDGLARPHSLDVVIDAVGGEGFPDRLGALRPGGRYVALGAVGGPLVRGDLRRIYLNDLTLHGAAHQPREVFAGLVTVIDTARLRPVEAKTYPLRDIAPAQADLAAGRPIRNLVLVPPEPTQ